MVGELRATGSNSDSSVRDGVTRVVDGNNGGSDDHDGDSNN